jgi:hypothetical protein
MNKTTEPLWCIRYVGPDDLHAASSKEAAEAMATKHRAAVAKLIENDPSLVADGITAESMDVVVEPWPWSAEAHAKDLLDDGR